MEMRAGAGAVMELTADRSKKARGAGGRGRAEWVRRGSRFAAVHDAQAALRVDHLRIERDRA